ncbi:hypothetical protein LVD15_06555 [Fulvivirga maritima]|uniref:hypothetical protein n=1 Tax=Fulvivirga maritima TaxID=2904247 RepID=UPI001F370DAC|nr:hypothetical protein [Fulvivirga maritima]UII28082.1 hypothetical protein LVD15_06555 [Fulvivirga maritima]
MRKLLLAIFALSSAVNMYATGREGEEACGEPETLTISGVVFVDENDNCVYDVGEKILPGMALLIGGEKVYTDNNGSYKFDVGVADYEIMLATTGDWTPGCEESIEVKASQLLNNYRNYNFSVSSVYAPKDLNMTLGR